VRQQETGLISMQLKLCATPSSPFPMNGTYFAYNGHPWRYCPVTYIYRKPCIVKLVLSSNWRVTLRLPFSKYSPLNSQNVSPHFGFGILWGHRPQKRRTCSGPTCTTMQNFTPIGATAETICNRTEKNQQT